MSESPWRQDPLAFLVGKLSAAEFFTECYEQRSLWTRHGDPQRYGDLLSLARIDDLLANSELPPAALDMARKSPPIQRSYFTFANGSIDRGAVIHHYQQGATIILPQLHLADARLADLCRALEDVFSTRVQANAYLTPANSQGFRSHYDDHDVFVLQVSGEKTWRLYQQSLEKPYRGEKFKASEYPPGAVTDTLTLRAGDCLYLPRGLMHDAESRGIQPSLHITVGLLGQSWADLMLEAVSEVALRDAEFRRCLPPGYAKPDCGREQLKAHFTHLLDRLSEQADFEEVFELMREKYLRSRRPNVAGGLSASSVPLLSDQYYRLRPYTQTLLRHNEREAVLVSAGGDIHFPAHALAALERVLGGEPFTAAMLGGLEREPAAALVSKLLAFGVVESINSVES